MFNKYFAAGYFIWGIVILILFCLRPKSRLHYMTIETFGCTKQKITVFTVCLIVFICTAPMGLSPLWNGEFSGPRNQYELMAESILEGHLYMDRDVDPVLLEMENPYDPQARKEAGVSYCWDHAFYKGRYYMYFGVVPVFLVFLPYRMITGTSLMTWHATQIFVALFIGGVFCVFYFLSKRFFPKITFGMYLLVSSAFAVMSVWYSIDAPALYCTAITAGICMEIWSIFFFFNAVWGSACEKKSIRYAFLGSLFGALAFGCRPPIAVANILVLPMLAEYLRSRKINGKLVRQLFFAASPYFIIAALLMAYNYTRFESLFEFGQTYQLTVADQSVYKDIASQFDLNKIWNNILANFISYTPVKQEFPFISHNGVFINFPILVFSIFGMFSKKVRDTLKKNRLVGLTGVLFMLPVLITVIDTLWSPYILERYRMDIYWIMGLLCFIVIGFYGCEHINEQFRRNYSCLMTVCAFLTVCGCFLLFLVPYDGNVTEYFPMTLETVKKVLALGF